MDVSHLTCSFFSDMIFEIHLQGFKKSPANYNLRRIATAKHSRGKTFAVGIENDRSHGKTFAGAASNNNICGWVRNRENRESFLLGCFATHASIYRAIKT